MTSVRGCQDTDGLRDYLQNAQHKMEVRRCGSYYTDLAHVDQMLHDEVSRLTGKLNRAKYLLASAIMSLKCI